MQAIQGIIEQKRAEVSRLQAEIETLEKAQALLDPAQPNEAAPQRRKGRPKGSKNKLTVNAPQKRKGRPKGSKNKTAAEKALASQTSKKAAKKGTRGRRKKSVEAPAES